MKRDFYEIKDINQNKNISLNKITDINFENKNFGLNDYLNFSPKLNLEVIFK